MTLVLGPFPFIGIPVTIVIRTLAVPFVVDPEPYVFGSIGVKKCSLSMFLAVGEVADVFPSFFEPENESN